MAHPRTPKLDCPSCGVGDYHSDDLCAACRDALRWVVRPEAHRENRRRQIIASKTGKDALDTAHPLIGSFPKDNGAWNCDLCEATIPVEDEFTLIPLIGTYAICTSCAEILPGWPTSWTHPKPRPCRCRACQTPVALALSL